MKKDIKIDSDFADVVQKKNKLVIPVIILIIIFILFGIASLLYFNNPKIIFAKTVNKHFNNTVQLAEANPLLDSLYSNNEMGAKSDINISIKDSKGEIKGLENLKIVLDYIENKNAKKGYTNAEIILNNKDSLKLSGLIQDEKLYFTIEDILDKYYYIEYEFISYLNDNKLTPENIEYILNIFKDNMTEILSDEELKSEKVSTNIDKEDINVQKISLQITEKTLYNIVEKSLNQIINDNKALEILSVMFEDSQSEIKTKIQEALESKPDLDNNKILFTYSIYNKLLTGVIKEEISSDDYNFILTNYKDTKNYIFSINQEEKLNIKIVSTETTSLIEGNITTYKISGNFDKENFYLKISENTLGSLELTGMIKEEKLRNKTEETFNFNLDYENDSNKYTIDIKSKTTIESNRSIPDLDISNNKNFDDITDDEMMDAYFKAEENGLVKFVVETFINPIFDKVVDNTNCSQSFACEEAEDGTALCQYCLDDECTVTDTIICPSN